MGAGCLLASQKYKGVHCTSMKHVRILPHASILLHKPKITKRALGSKSYLLTTILALWPKSKMGRPNSERQSCKSCFGPTGLEGVLGSKHFRVLPLISHFGYFELFNLTFFWNHLKSGESPSFTLIQSVFDFHSLFSTVLVLKIVVSFLCEVKDLVFPK